MEEFNIAWDWARYNVYCLLGYALPLVFALVGVLSRSRRVFYITVIGSVITTFQAVCFAIEVKWELRRAAAITNEQTALAGDSGVNLLFAPLIAAFQAILFTAFCYIVVFLIAQNVREQFDTKARATRKHEKLREQLSEVSD